jgi:citrate synthase
LTASFDVSRADGWMAHALEQLEDNRLVRPRAEYVGDEGRTWMPVEER